MKKGIQISTELNKIVDSIKTEMNIVSISELSGVSTIVVESVIIFDNLSVVMNLQAGMIVTINNINHSVSNVVNIPSQKSFDITAINLVATKWNVAANFKPGTRAEINQILTQESNDINRYKKFPLIWLITPIAKDFDHRVLDFQSELVLVLAYNSNNTDRTQTRIDETFDLVLQPLLKLFLLWVQSSDYNYMFEFNGHEKPINYKAENYPFYGTSDKSKNVLNTTTDAIEVVFDLDFKKQYE